MGTRQDCNGRVTSRLAEPRVTVVFAGDEASNHFICMPVSMYVCRQGKLISGLIV